MMPDNIYDSCPIRVKLDQKLTTKVSANKLLFFSKKDDRFKSRELKLKRYVVNDELINICRSYIILWIKKEWNQCRLTIPFDR